jgi:hypothetical protein
MERVTTAAEWIDDNMDETRVALIRIEKKLKKMPEGRQLAVKAAMRTLMAAADAPVTRTVAGPRTFVRTR